MLTVQKNLVDFLLPHAKDVTIEDVRIGLGYCAVKIDTGHAGVAWTPPDRPSSCTHLSTAGTLAGAPAGKLLAMLTNSSSALMRAVGLATANAIIASLPKPPGSREEIISSLKITPADHVAMVGCFGPLLSDLRKTGCRFDIIEKNSDSGEKTLSPEEGKKALASCTVAIITGTTLINGTFDDVAASLGNPRAAILLGPSSPLCGAAFRDTKITHVAGSRVKNPDAVLRIVSEGGGTMLLKSHLDFEVVFVRPGK